MPKYELCVEERTRYCALYEADNKADAWKMYYADKDLEPSDRDIMYSHIEEVTEDA